MSICPPKPDTERRCFAPCLPGTFCQCKGSVIAKGDTDALAELLATFERLPASAYTEEMKSYRHIVERLATPTSNIKDNPDD